MRRKYIYYGRGTLGMSRLIGRMKAVLITNSSEETIPMVALLEAIRIRILFLHPSVSLQEMQVQVRQGLRKLLQVRFIHIHWQGVHVATLRISHHTEH